MSLPFDDSQLLGVFSAEVKDHIENITSGILALEKSPGDSKILQELFRVSHSLKGAAATLGFDSVKEIAHRMEDMFDAVRAGKIQFHKGLVDQVFSGLDGINAIMADIGGGREPDKDISDLIKGMTDLFGAKPQKIGKNKRNGQKTIKARGRVEKSGSGKNKKANPVKKKKSGPERQRETVGPKAPEVSPGPPMKAKGGPGGQEKPRTGEGPLEEFIRVPVKKINTLLNLGGELVINKIKTNQKVSSFKKSIKKAKELQRRLGVLGDQTKEPSISESRETMSETLHRCIQDADVIRKELLSLYDEIMGEAIRIDPIVDELQQQIKKIRMLPCSTLFVIFPRVVRDLAREQGKEIEFQMEGGETELDKKVLEEIKDPLIHVLRNAVDHGVETPEEREAQNKPKTATIKLTAYYQGANVVLELSDDGGGINAERIKEVAIKKGLKTPEEIERITRDEILNFIFLPGFSTSRFITDVSGRGVGMDVLRDRIESLKGSVEVVSEEGKGTTFRMELPLTIAIIHVLLVDVQDKTLAIPLTGVEEVVKISSNEISRVENRMAFDKRGKTVPLVYLDDALGMPASRNGGVPGDSYLNVAIISNIFGRVGFIVDGIRGKEEIYIKSVGAHVGKLKNVSGATMLGTGEVIVILDPGDLVNSSRNLQPLNPSLKGFESPVQRKRKILVAEDSLTTREMMKTLLDGEGYAVDVAIDGLEALEKMGQGKYDLVLSDIEMPRMTGLQLCKKLKANDKYKEIPFVFVTALAKEEEKRQGIEVGAQAYIVKTSFEQSTLLDTISRLIN